MKRIENTIIIPMMVLLCFFCFPAWSQENIHHVPWLSKNNVIELFLGNDEHFPFREVTISATSVPSWLQLLPQKQELQLLPKGNTIVRFMFTLDNTAPADVATTLHFVIKEEHGQSWLRDITVVIDKPEKTVLYQNYPNPFNPSTVISYLLSQRTYVALKIYDVLGREIATLVNEMQDAGYKSVAWNASDIPNGVYLYRLATGSEMQTKRMIVLK